MLSSCGGASNGGAKDGELACQGGPTWIFGGLLAGLIELEESLLLAWSDLRGLGSAPCQFDCGVLGGQGVEGCGGRGGVLHEDGEGGALTLLSRESSGIGRLLCLAWIRESTGVMHGWDGTYLVMVGWSSLPWVTGSCLGELCWWSSCRK